MIGEIKAEERDAYKIEEENSGSDVDSELNEHLVSGDSVTRAVDEIFENNMN